MKPNLFDFATSELSQDAFICWLLAWADPTCESQDRPLHQLGSAFLRALLEASSVEVPTTITRVTVKPQHEHVDVLAMVNDEIVILIEDKTNTRNHSNQLARYWQTIETAFPTRKLAAVYFKTGDQCSYDDIRSAGYSCFLRSDFLKLLAYGKEIGIQHPIFSDFHEYLSRIEQRVTDYQRLPFHQWNSDCWKGFFMELRERLGEGKSIQVSLPRHFGQEGASDPMDGPWTTGFFKEPVIGPVRLEATNLDGDGTLADSPFRSFYERLGGKSVGQRDIGIGHQKLAEVAYGWEDFRTLNSLGREE